MNIAIFGRELPSDKLPLLCSIIEKFSINKVEIFINNKLFGDQIKTTFKTKTNIHEYKTPEQIKECDLIMSLGGDGTFLDAAHFVVGLDIPVCGVNTGRLGFLSNITIDNIDEAVSDIVNSKYKIENRVMLEVRPVKGTHFLDGLALNDIYVLRNTSDALMSVTVTLDDDYLNTYWSDGLIVSTPTGSTAYSLSCGGPIVMPKSNNFILTPISPHNLTARPFIYSDNSVLNIKIKSREDYFKLSLDGKIYKLSTDVELEIFKSKSRVRLVKLNSNTYFNTLREKLAWGRDSRN